MFAAIYLPNFCLQAVLRSGEEAPGRGQAIALVDGDVNKGAILQLTEAARAAGVTEGMAAAQAMARCPGLLFKTRSAELETTAAHILLQTAAAFSPHLENTAPGVCTIDLKGLGFEWPPGAGEEEGRSKMEGRTQPAFGFLDEVPVRASARPADDSPLEKWMKNIVVALDSLHLAAQVAIAATPEIALLAAQAARPVLVVEDAPDFVAALPIQALQPAPEIHDLLRRWGIHRVGQFLALGKEAVAGRLGADALELFERAAIDTIRPLEIVVPPDTFEEQMDFEAMVETIEPLLFVLRRFVEQLAMRVTLNYRVISELRLRLFLESGAAYERFFKIPSPTSHVETLMRMLHTHLENVRTDSPIISLRLAAAPCRAENRQFGLFESALRDPNQFHETLARLTALLGADRVGIPVVDQTHRPDSFHLGRPEFDGRRQEPAAERPAPPPGLALRRFRPCIMADVTLEHGKPVFIHSLLISSVIQRARGPWIGSGDWWNQRRWSRNEWDVQLRDGGLYRLFSTGSSWFVEGVYD